MILIYMYLKQSIVCDNDTADTQKSQHLQVLCCLFLVKRKVGLKYMYRYLKSVLNLLVIKESNNIFSTTYLYLGKEKIYTYTLVC